jgi:hypothetical protein
VAKTNLSGSLVRLGERPAGLQRVNTMSTARVEQNGNYGKTTFRMPP